MTLPLGYEEPQRKIKMIDFFFAEKKKALRNVLTKFAELKKT